ncbi:polysaccharide biosynthesis C-terminal domain-containing protein [Pedobacter glucosidilyticus]|uniref:polysaccharide biosynthesis C-terminal domain-containing protein n=1 Tax=Pedobacter glucosidilyticus TaxID=1122941 RepID=UPI0026EAEF5A|nr:polysaccharide biosynthesis C-terminal domain-containing protein [Pedobacter glucosidilyticus]
MIKSIFYNFQSSVGYTILNAFIVIYTLKYIGLDGRGNISLFLLNTSLVQIFTAIIGTSSIGFVYHRTSLSSLTLVTIFWCFITAPIASFIMFWLGIIPQNQLFQTISAAILFTIIQNIMEILLVNKFYKKYNLIRISQPVLHILFIFSFIKLYDSFNDINYVNLLLSALLIVSFLSLLFIIRLFTFERKFSIKETFYQCFKIGLVNQLNNLVLLFNLRINYFVINKFLGLSLLGIFSIVTLLAESIWIFSKSVATIFFSQVVKNDGAVNIKIIRNKMLTLSLIGTFLIMVIIFCIPNFLYVKVLGEEFKQIKMLLFYFTPGILAKSLNTIYIEYFGVINKRQLNTVSFLIGLLTIAILGLLLTYKYGIVGAAIAGSISQVSSLLFSLYADRKIIL